MGRCPWFSCENMYFILSILATLCARTTAQHTYSVGQSNKFILDIEVIMATATRKQNEKLAYIFSDSFTHESRFTGYRSNSKPRRMKPDGSLNTYPHADSKFDSLKICNRSQGNATLDIHQWRGGVSAWANDYPDLTVIAAGGCNIANTSLGESLNVMGDFIKLLFKFLEDLTVIGRQRAAFKNEFDKNMETHIFLVIGIPVWGLQGFRADTLEEKLRINQQVTHARRKANNSLRQTKRSLWTSYRAAVFIPDMGEEIAFSGIHYNWDSQRLYNEQICDTMIKLLCQHCQFSQEYNKEEHKNKDASQCRGALPF